MYARITTTTSDSNRIDEVVHYAQTTLIPALKQIPGINASYCLVDRQSGKAMVMTVYESLESLHAADERAKQLREQTTSDNPGTAAANVETYEVIVLV